MVFAKSEKPVAATFIKKFKARGCNFFVKCLGRVPVALCENEKRALHEQLHCIRFFDCCGRKIQDIGNFGEIAIFSKILDIRHGMFLCAIMALIDGAAGNFVQNRKAELAQRKYD